MHTQRSFLAATAVAAVFAPVSAHAAKFVGSKASASRPTALRALDGASQGRELWAIGYQFELSDTVMTYNGHNNTACKTAADSVYNLDEWGNRDGLKTEHCSAEVKAEDDANKALIALAWSDDKKNTAICDGDAETCDHYDAMLQNYNCEFAVVYEAMMADEGCDLAQLLNDYDAYLATLTPEPTTAPEPTPTPESEAPTPVPPSCTWAEAADCVKVATYAWWALEDVYDAQARKGTISKSAGLSSAEAIGEEEAGVSAGMSLIPSACLVASAALTCYFA